MTYVSPSLFYKRPCVFVGKDRLETMKRHETLIQEVTVIVLV